jgi:hypothetical protein
MRAHPIIRALRAERDPYNRASRVLVRIQEANDLIEELNVVRAEAIYEVYKVQGATRTAALSVAAGRTSIALSSRSRGETPSGSPKSGNAKRLSKASWHKPVGGYKCHHFEQGKGVNHEPDKFAGGPNPRKIVGLIFACMTVHAVAKGRRVSPLRRR